MLGKIRTQTKFKAPLRKAFDIVSDCYSDGVDGAGAADPHYEEATDGDEDGTGAEKQEGDDDDGDDAFAYIMDYQLRSRPFQARDKV